MSRYVLDEDARLACEHAGRVALPRRLEQDWVRIEGRRVLVATDPEGCAIRGCPNANPPLGIRPCLHTMRVQIGYSTLVRVGGKPLCLDTVRGLTDGTPAGQVPYTVRDAGQALVVER